MTAYDHIAAANTTLRKWQSDPAEAKRWFDVGGYMRNEYFNDDGSVKTFDQWLEKSSSYAAKKYRDGDDRYVATVESVRSNKPRTINGGFEYGGPDWDPYGGSNAVQREMRELINKVLQGQIDSHSVKDVVMAGAIGAAVAVAGNAV